MSKFMCLVLSAVFVISVSVPAYATSTFGSSVVVDTGPIFTVATVVCTALGAIWCIRKVIKTVNKS
jgi:hypothetical protein